MRKTRRSGFYWRLYSYCPTRATFCRIALFAARSRRHQIIHAVVIHFISANMDLMQTCAYYYFLIVGVLQHKRLRVVRLHFKLQKILQSVRNFTMNFRCLFCVKLEMLKNRILGHRKLANGQASVYQKHYWQYEQKKWKNVNCMWKYLDEMKIRGRIFAGCVSNLRDAHDWDVSSQVRVDRSAKMLFTSRIGEVCMCKSSHNTRRLSYIAHILLPHAKAG